MGEECALGETVPLKGKLSLKDAELTELLIEHLFTQGPLTELWVLTNTAEHAVTIDGNANVMLSGAHEGVEWCGAPG